MKTLNQTFCQALDFEYIDELEFSCEKIHEKVRLRCLKKMKKKHFAAYNRWSCSLFAQELKQKKQKAFSIEKIHPLVGYGVIAKERIAPLTFIGEYTGEVRNRVRSDSKNDYAFGYVDGRFTTPWVIDASKKGNFTRFFNHSYSPNLISRWIIADEVAHIAFFSSCVIEVGDKMTFDYGPYYWRNRPIPQSL